MPGTPIADENGSIIVPQFQSPDFDPDAQIGWAILYDGSAYFYNVSVSGQIMGNTYVINELGFFTYSGIPMLGNLVSSTGIASANSGTGPVGIPGSWITDFDDEFPGSTLDLTKWQVDTGTGNNVTFSGSNVSVGVNGLVLTVASATSGAQIQTAAYTLPVGGCCEARIWFPGPFPPGAPLYGAPGNTIYNWPAWWTGDLSTWPAEGEIDIAESYNGTLTNNYHSPSGSHNGPSPGPAGNWSNSWHTYGMYRGPDHADYYFDGVLVHTQATDDGGGGQGLLLTAGSGNTAAYGAASEVLVGYVRTWLPTTLGLDPFGNQYLSGDSTYVPAGDGTFSQYSNIAAEGMSFISSTGSSLSSADGQFTYSGIPAANNMTSSNASAGNTDIYGNLWLSGSVAYGSDGAGGQYALRTQVFGAAGGAFRLYSAATQAGPWTAIGAEVAVTATGLVILGNLSATSGTASSPSLVTTDTPHAVTFTNSWANQAGGNMPLRYWMNPDNTVTLKGIIASGTAAAVCNNLPAAYRNPTWNAFHPIVSTVFDPGYIQVGSDGSVVIHAATVTGKAWIIDITWPLS
jgi:hypothetical protein